MTTWRPTTHCRDCGVSVAGEWYTVHDHVWAAAGMERLGGCLCVGCLEARLGRGLNAADFTAAEINSLDPKWNRYAWASRTDRLVARLLDCAPLPGQLSLF